MVPVDRGVAWARRQLPEGANYGGKYAEPRWHRVAKVKDLAIFTACNRVIDVPIDTTPDVPDGESACARCTKRNPRPH